MLCCQYADKNTIPIGFTLHSLTAYLIYGFAALI